MALKKGDSVRALPGVKDQDNDTDLGGWQGRIEDIDKDKETFVYIAWDSITLKQMPLEYIMSALDEDYEYCQMWLEDKEVEPAEPRDRPEDVEEAVSELFEKYESGPKREEEQLIRQILDSEDLSITEETQNKFYKYLQEHIKYPCIVTGTEDFSWEEPYLLGIFDDREYQKLKKTKPSYTDRYYLKGPVKIIDELYGIIFRVKRISDNRLFELPLWDLETADKQDSSTSLLKAYSFWMTNYR
jgi:hypothetical protein